MITAEMLKKYNMTTLGHHKKCFGDNTDTEKTFYKTFLMQTDHIPLKIFESFIENIATASVLEMPNVIIGFFKDIKVTYNEVLTARKTAREEINRIEAELAEVTSKQ